MRFESQLGINVSGMTISCSRSVTLPPAPPPLAARNRVAIWRRLYGFSQTREMDAAAQELTINVATAGASGAVGGRMRCSRATDAGTPLRWRSFSRYARGRAAFN